MGLSKLQQQVRAHAAQTRLPPGCGAGLRRVVSLPDPANAPCSLQLKKKEKERKAAGKTATPVSAAAKAKSAADAQAFMCATCRQTFPVNVKARHKAACNTAVRR